MDGVQAMSCLFSSFLFLKHYFTTYLYIMYGLIDTYHHHFGVSEIGMGVMDSHFCISFVF